MYQKNNNIASVALSFVVCCVFAAIFYMVINNRQYIVDQITVWQFQPTSEVLALIERAGMNDDGKFIYLASQPVLDGTQNFNRECNRVETTTSILGCYSDGKIYLYNVTDEQLDGIREVTAAHETLHAIYHRMSDGEKNEVNKLLEAEYEKLKNDEKLSKLMAYYTKAEPGQRGNELHSLIGTEVLDISKELEDHYSKYFSDRSKVVALDEKYSSVFSQLEQRADDLIAQINSLHNSIVSRTAQYQSDVAVLNSDIIEHNQRVKNNSFNSQSEANNEYSQLAARVSQANTLRSGINDDIVTYNRLQAEYNSLASQSEKLNNSIDSTLAPAPSV